MDDEQRARELATKLQDCVEVVRIGGGIERMFIDEHGIELLAAAFAEVRSDTFQDALKPLKRRLKIDAEFSEPGHDRWRHHKSRAEALGEAIDDVRALSAEPAVPDPTKPESQAPMEAAPLPCPFCGGPAMIAEYGDGQHIVFCASCDCHLSPEETASDAITAWNRRSGTADPTKALARLFADWWRTPVAKWDLETASRCGLIHPVDAGEYALTDLGKSAISLAGGGACRS